MSVKRSVNTKFWDDPYVNDLDPIEKLMFLYFLTNPLTTISGCYEIQVRRIAFDTGIDKDMVLKILDRFSADNKIYYIDNWLVMRNFIKNQSLTEDVKKGITRTIAEIPLETAKKILDKLPETLVGGTSTDILYLTLLNLTLLNLTLPNGKKQDSKESSENKKTVKKATKDLSDGLSF